MMARYLRYAAAALGLAAACAAVLFFLNASKRDACLKGEGRDAEEACTLLLDLYPAAQKAPIYARRGALYAKAGRKDTAAADYEALVGLSAAGKARKGLMSTPYQFLAARAQEKEDETGQKKYLELAVAAGGADPSVYVALAGIYAGEKRGGEALKLLETAAGLGGPKGHPYYNALASAYEAGEDYPEAYDALKEGLTVRAPRPVLAETAKHMGLVCYELKRYPEAETYLSYAVRAGAPCLECGLLLTTIRGSLAPQPARQPAPRAAKRRK